VLVAAYLERVDPVLVHRLKKIIYYFFTRAHGGGGFWIWGFFFGFVGCGKERERRRGTYVSWTDDGTVPVGHEDIVAVLEAVGARSVADALLALFEFLEQAEVAWNCGWGEEGGIEIDQLCD